jgi:hypothetical protein
VDFLVNYDASLSQDFYLLAAKYEQEGEEWIKVVGFADDYMKGALLVEVIDARKLKPIWRGVCNANVTLDEIAEEEKDERVNYAVKELLRTFPPK